MASKTKMTITSTMLKMMVVLVASSTALQSQELSLRTIEVAEVVADKCANRLNRRMSTRLVSNRVKTSGIRTMEEDEAGADEEIVVEIEAVVVETGVVVAMAAMVAMETMVDSAARLITTHAVDSAKEAMIKVMGATRVAVVAVAIRAVVVAITKAKVVATKAVVAVVVIRDVVAIRTITEAAVVAETTIVPQVILLPMPNVKSSREKSAQSSKRSARKCEQTPSHNIKEFSYRRRKGSILLSLAS